MKEKTKKKAPKEEPKKEEVKEEIKDIVVVPEVMTPPVPMEYKSKLTRAQIEILKTTIAKGASDDELKMFLYVCERTKLDPFTKQIHLVPRWDSKMGRDIRIPIVGIDGLRSVAERTGDYAGNDDPKFDDEEKPQKATVSVFKMVQGTRVEFTATARWSQYIPLKKDKTIASPLWEKMPHLMLGKCAEALALRKAFPQVMSGLYVAEEMHQAQVVEAKVEDSYGTAKRMLEKIADPKELVKALKKIKDSPKYDKGQKVELEKLIKDRIAILNAPKNVPVTEPNDPVGEESKAI